MGASISIHPEIIKSAEVSFVDKKTGRLFTQEEINNICEKACKEFDYKSAFYDSYKVVKKPYAELAKRIAEGSNK